MKLKDLSDLFLHELWTLYGAKIQVTAWLLHMSCQARHHELREELEKDADSATENGYLIRSIVGSYQATSPVKTCGATSDLTAASELLFSTCVAEGTGALDVALICASLDIVQHELARLERLRSYAKALSDWQTLEILNTVLDDVALAKHRFAELMDRYIDLEFVSEPELLRVPNRTPAPLVTIEGL
jgi:ferritin-like metal-binding protein YciE